MKELQEEYLFLNRSGINSWADVFNAKHKAERQLADMLDEFMRLEAVIEQKEREEKQSEKETDRKYPTR